MKKLLKNLNLKQRFLIIFFVFFLFSLYQIFSDTIFIYFKEKDNYTIQIQNLKFTKDINRFINNLQKDKINFNVHIKDDKNYKKVLLNKTKNLKIELKNLVLKYNNSDKNFKDNVYLILDQFTYIIKNIDNLNNKNILYKYQLISQKLFLFISFNTHNIKVESSKSTQLLSLILNDIPYIIYNLANLENIKAPLVLSVKGEHWLEEPVDYIYSANLVHFVSFDCVEMMFAGIAKHLRREGLLVLYGPYNQDGFTSEGNVRLDAWLKSEVNPLAGIKELDEISLLANRHGLKLEANHRMPANNLLLIFRHSGDAL